MPPLQGPGGIVDVRVVGAFQPRGESGGEFGFGGGSGLEDGEVVERGPG